MYNVLLYVCCNIPPTARETAPSALIAGAAALRSAEVSLSHAALSPSQCTYPGCVPHSEFSDEGHQRCLVCGPDISGLWHTEVHAHCQMKGPERWDALTHTHAPHKLQDGMDPTKAHVKTLCASQTSQTQGMIFNLQAAHTTVLPQHRFGSRLLTARRA